MPECARTRGIGAGQPLAQGKKKRKKSQAQEGASHGPEGATRQPTPEGRGGGAVFFDPGEKSPVDPHEEGEGSLQRRKCPRPSRDVGGFGELLSSSGDEERIQASAGGTGATGEAELQRRGKAVTSGPRGDVPPPGAAPRKRLPLYPSKRWAVYEDSTLDETSMPSRLDQFVARIHKGPEVEVETVEEFTDAILREDTKALARKFELLSTMREMLRETVAKLEESQWQVSDLRPSSEEKAKRVEELLAKVKEAGARAQQSEESASTLQAEVEGLRNEIAGARSLLTVKEKREVEAAQAIERLSKDTERLKADVAGLERKVRHLKKAEGKSVENYKKSVAFKEDVAQLYGGKVQKLLGVFLREFKVHAPEADPTKFDILRSLFDEAEGTGGDEEGDDREKEGPSGGGAGSSTGGRAGGEQEQGGR